MPVAQGTFFMRTTRVVCNCAPCSTKPEAERDMSATHFEAHSGAGTAKKWKTSLRIPAGCLKEVPAGVFLLVRVLISAVLASRCRTI